MSDIAWLRSAMASTALLALSTPALTQTPGRIAAAPMPAPAGKTPKITLGCLPPGGTAPKPCATANRSTVLSLRAQQPATRQSRFLVFRAIGTAGRSARVKLQPKWFIDHSMEIKVPAELCRGAAGQQFEIQVLLSDMQQAESSPGAQSIGSFQLRC